MKSLFQTLMHFIQITTLGNSEFFGNLTLQRRNPGGRVSDGTRGLILGGYHEPAARDNIDYCTIASTGDFIDFGNLTSARFAIASGAVSSSTRGVTAGGNTAPAYINVMDYVQIQTIGDALDFGDLTTNLSNSSGVNNAVRGLFCGGQNPGLTPVTRSNIQSITIASKGNSVDIGDLQAGRYYGAGVCNDVRGVVGGGIILQPGAPNMATSLEFVTIASSGNAVIFGDLTIKRAKTASAETHIRGVFIGSDSGTPSTSTYINVMDFITIATTGNAQDFGDTSMIQSAGSGVSSSTRGVFAIGSSDANYKNILEYITISTTGNSSDFGDLTRSGVHCNSYSNSTRGVFHSGYQYPASPNFSNNIEFVTIATKGNTVDFGDSLLGGFGCGGSSPTRGVAGGGYFQAAPTGETGGFTNIIDFVEIATTGNAVDFGDTTNVVRHIKGGSNGHGGL